MASMKRLIGTLVLAGASLVSSTAAAQDIPSLLIDHAHCEKKAASTSLNLLFRYPDLAD